MRQILRDQQGRFDYNQLVLVCWVLIVVFSTSVIFFTLEKVGEVYSGKFQVAMFAGFLTLGGFLLTLKTFVVVQFKTQLFEKEPYRKVFMSTKTKSTYLKGDYFLPLSEMAKLLLLSVVLSIGTSLFQITVGFLKSDLVSSFCMALGIATLFVVAFAWWIVRKNTIQMIGFWEEEEMTGIDLADE